MFGSNLSEERKLALQIKNELDTTIKSFVRRSNDKYGQMLQKYLNDIKKNSMKLSKLHAKGKPNKGSFVKLVSYERESDAINNVFSALIYEQSPSIEFSHLQKNVRKIPKMQKIKIINEYAKIRKNRRHRPPRAFEMAYYTFDLLTNYGMFRDIHRHRALTHERQLLTTDHKYHTPNEIMELGIKKEFSECMENTKNVFEKIRKKLPEQAQYVVNFAYNYPYFMKLNLREATHLIELRTVPQGHTDYRKISQKMYKLIEKDIQY